jgi:hypothetical protein
MPRVRRDVSQQREHLRVDALSALQPKRTGGHASCCRRRTPLRRSTLHQLVLVEHGAEPLPLGGVKHCA